MLRPVLRSRAVTVLEPSAQLWRLRRFCAQNPSVVIKRFGFWQAWIPVSNGGTVITRYVLKDLLDKLEGILSSAGTDAADRGIGRCSTITSIAGDPCLGESAEPG
jgi:hypothetical protein